MQRSIGQILESKKEETAPAVNTFFLIELKTQKDFEYWKCLLVGNAYFLQIIVAIYEFKIEPGGIGDPCTVWWECASDVCQNGHCIGRF